MSMKPAAFIFLCAASALGGLGTVALWLAPPHGGDSRDVLVLAVALAGAAFALLAARRMNGQSGRTM